MHCYKAVYLIACACHRFLINYSIYNIHCQVTYVYNACLCMCLSALYNFYAILQGQQEKAALVVQRTTVKQGRFLWCHLTDECTVQLEQHSRICFRKKLQPRTLKQRAKHPIKTHIWGGISSRGATSLVMFMGIMDVQCLGALYEAGLILYLSFRGGSQMGIDCTKTMTQNIPQSS